MMNKETSDSNEILWSSYKPFKLLASGLTAEIYLATGPGDENVAIKIFTHKSERFYRNEISILKKLTPHKNVIKMIGHGKVNIPADPFLNRCFIIFEYAPNGDLLSLIENEGKLGEEKSKEIFMAVLFWFSSLI